MIHCASIKASIHKKGALIKKGENIAALKALSEAISEWIASKRHLIKMISKMTTQDAATDRPGRPKSDVTDTLGSPMFKVNGEDVFDVPSRNLHDGLLGCATSTFPNAQR